MARTKQTARKSTGGAAPWRQYANGGPPLYYNYGKRPSQQQTTLEKPLSSDTSSSPTNKASKARSSSTTSKFSNTPSSSSSSPPPSPAQKAVLSTPDLLLIILSQLPHSSLLNAQRVNKTWASLFTCVEIQASLFQCARPKGAALYVEPSSDILMDRFGAFWPVDDDDDGRDGGGRGRGARDGERKAVFEKKNLVERFHAEKEEGWEVGILGDGDVDGDGDKVSSTISHGTSSEPHSQSTITAPQQSQQVKHLDKCPFAHKWRPLQISQPPIHFLELIQEVSQRVGGTLEFRCVIHRPEGIRMGLLYDALRHWHEVERSRADVLWDRSVGDLVNKAHIYLDGDPGFKRTTTSEEGDKRCVTIWGHSGVGCGQYGGLTYANHHRSGCKTQVIESEGEQVEYCMSAGKRLSYDMRMLFADDSEEDMERYEDDDW